MAFTEHQNTERFSLLLLEPGEIYFKDYGVYLYPDDIPEADAPKRRQKGRLKICSKSMLFVPEEINRPILKFPLNKHSVAEQWTGPLLSKLHSKENIIRLQNDHVVEMLEGNFIKPYVFIRKKVSYQFSLTYGSIEKCLTYILQLIRASTLPAAEHDCMIAAMVLSWQSRISFDRSCLGDLYEQIILETKASKITPLVVNPGLVLLTSQRLYFQPFNNIEQWPCLKVNLSDVKRVIRRRFLLRQIGLELYCSDSSVIQHLFLAFKSQHERDSLYQHLIKQDALQLEDSGQENMTLRWQNGVISNYDYLLYINSLADRSFNDLTQYPVFPWVIADYTSPTLDMDDVSTYRDLSRPVGALNDERLQRLKDRYKDMGEPKFLYGSHYSTPGFVLFYLVRKMPQYMLCLQNGRFDHPDRMFNSVPDTWRNVTTDSSDFKELIPEFYDTSTKGDFLTNSKNLDFGVRQDGKVVGDVELPPWAEGPEDMIYKCRQVLESPYVSENLHNWIDLIFGHKQTGEEAIKANNLFYYLTYEGNIDLDSIKEIHERHSLEVQIMEFGQTPKQIFTQPHPQRLPTPKIERGFSMSEGFTTPEVSALSTETTAGTEDEVETQGRRSSTLAFQWKRNMANLTKVVQHELHKEKITDVCFSHNAESVFSVSQDCLLKLFSLGEKQQIRSASISNMALSSCLLLSDKTVVVGSWDNYIYIYDIEFGKVLESTMAHDDAVCDISWKNGVLATASWDSTAKIWSFRPQETRRGGTTAHLLAELEHESGVSCVDLMEDDARRLATGTVDGCVVLWDLESSSCIGRYEIHSSTVTSVAFNPDGSKIVSCSDDQTLKVLDVQTGTVLFSKDAGSELRCLCWDGATVLTGCESGAILTWDLLNVELLKETSAHNGAVTCITVSHDGSFIATGGEDRKVIVWQSSEI